MKVKLTKEAGQFIEANSARVDEWYYLPYYWKRIDDDVFEQVTFENIPKYVKDILKENREKKLDV